MPWNRAGVTESPFVTVFRHAHIPGASHIMTFVILTARSLGRKRGALCSFAGPVLARAHRMGASCARTAQCRRDLRRPALLASSYGIVVALVLEKWAPKDAFVSILGAALVGMLLAWLVSLAAHVSFRKRVSPSVLAGIAHALAPLAAGARRWASCLSSWRFSRRDGSSHLTLISGAVHSGVLTAAYFLLKKKFSSGAYTLFCF